MSGVAAIELQQSLQAAMAAYHAGRHAEACDAFGRAARIQPKNPEILNGLGSALRRTGRAADAEAAYRRAIAVRPAYAEAHFNLGNLLAEIDRLDEAAAAYRRAVGIRPDYIAALIALGGVLVRTENWKRAEETYRLALAKAPNAAKAHLGLAHAIDRGGKPSADGLDHLAAARRLAPEDTEIACAHGLALVQAGRSEEAYDAFQNAVALDPRRVDARVNLANLLAERGENDRARIHFAEALEVDPACVEAMVGLGNIAEREDKTAEAETLYRRALAADPNYTDAHVNLGVALNAAGRSEAALASLRRALAIDPRCANAHANLGHALMGMGEWQDALGALDRALTIAPEHVDARINRATVRLLTRDFAGGWRDYLARDAKQSVGIGVHREALPAKLDGQRLLVLADQGLGDELFFLRFAAVLKARGATVYYRAGDKIAAMVARSGAVDRVVGPSEAPPGVTLTLSVGDLPFLLGLASVKDVPPPLPIPPLPEARAAMAERLAALGPAPRIGVTWRAGTKIHHNSLFKEAPRAALAGALADAPGTLIALQRQPAEGEVAAFADEAGRTVHDMTALNESLEDMLALLALLDDYVCVSNTNVHLRAGAGRTSRVLMPHPPEFRWMADGDESPWFPGTRIYRQTAAGDWACALTRLKEELS
jgi:tetratricopeptide (TPR) repeat protein